MENEIVNDYGGKKGLRYASLGAGHLYEDFAILTQLIDSGATISTITIVDKLYKVLFSEFERECEVPFISMTKHQKLEELIENYYKQIGLSHIHERNNKDSILLVITQFFNWIASIQKAPVTLKIYSDINEYLSQGNSNDILVDSDVPSSSIKTPLSFYDQKSIYWMPCGRTKFKVTDDNKKKVERVENIDFIKIQNNIATLYRKNSDDSTSRVSTIENITSFQAERNGKDQGATVSIDKQ